MAGLLLLLQGEGGAEGEKPAEEEEERLSAWR